MFVDESSIWTLRGGLYHHRKKSKIPKSNTVWGKNAEKVHVWSGITWAGSIPFILFDNNLTGEGYQEINEEHLAPYMANFNQGLCRLLQDNAPTHVTFSNGYDNGKNIKR